MPPGRAKHELTANLRLGAQEHVELRLRVEPSGTNADLTEDDSAQRRAAAEAWRARFAKLESPGNRLAEKTFASNIRDVGSFALLEGKRDEWLALQAGVPLYPVLFGRDAVTAGWQSALVDRGDSLAASLVRLGRMQTHRFDDFHDEEPGRLPYQMRNGPLELLNKNPDRAYYADYAGPLMYVISLANLYAWTGGAWSVVTTSAGPPARSGMAMAFDSTRKQVVLFGGSSERSCFSGS